MRNADVSATEFKFADKKNKYALMGGMGISHLFLRKSSDIPFQYRPGYAYKINTGKISGNFLWQLSRELTDDHYDPNDLGFQRTNNEVEHTAVLNYNIYKPFRKFLNFNSKFQVDYSNLYKSGKYTGMGIEGNVNTTFINYLSLGFYYDFNPIRHHDYYEPRVTGKYYSVPQNYTFGFWFSPDYRKRFALDIKSDINLFNEKGRNSLDYDLSPRFRFSDKLLLVYGFNQVVDNHDIGFVKIDTAGEIIFGRRYVESISNSLRLSYIFTNKMSLLFRARHYWSSALYNKFFLLNEKGFTQDEIILNENQNINFNAFNIDFSFLWEFSPGSELRLVWKNAILNEGEDVITRYRKNLITTLDDPQLNSITLKCLYYLDYGMVKRK